MKKFAALLLALAMVLSLVPMASADEEPIIIRWGTHYTAERDPNLINETTGKYAMDKEDERQLRLAAEKVVLEKHNVKIVHVQYKQDVQSELVLSVLSGNPVCEIAHMWNGSESTVLAQNVLQPLEQYASIFEGAEWMLPTAVYGHNYFINGNMAFEQYFPMLVNLTMLEKVDALKEADGTTLYPMEMLERGDWTWSNFKDYLGKIHAYYNNEPAPEGAKVPSITAYEVDFRQSGQSAMYSNGGGIYGDTGLTADSQESIDAIAYLRELMELDYVRVCGVYGDGWTPQWCECGYDFGRGAAVFADCPVWVVKGQVDACTERGESVAIMPWPAADRLVTKNADGSVTYAPEYRQPVSVGDIDGVLKGISPEMTKLALESWRTYWETYYSMKAGVESMDQYKDAVAKDEATARGLDIFNETYGDGVLYAFKFNSKMCNPNNVAGNLGFAGPWEEIMGKGLMGVDAMPSYEIAIKANLNKFTEKAAEMEAILGSAALHDNQAPSVKASGKVVVAMNADLSAIDWTQYFSAEDGFDGVMDPAMANYNLDGVDVTKAGAYKVEATFEDKAENKGSAKVDVIVYDPANTTAPTLTVVEELPTIVMDTDATTIDWTTYVAEAKDASGLDLKANVVADMSVLDTSMPDVYPVTLTVTDYAGNTAEATIEVEVVVE